MALSEATAVATSCSPRRASRGMPAPEKPRQPVVGRYPAFLQAKTYRRSNSTHCERGRMSPLTSLCGNTRRPPGINNLQRRPGLQCIDSSFRLRVVTHTLTGLINSACRVLSHGWLGVGYRMSPASRALGYFQPLVNAHALLPPCGPGRWLLDLRRIQNLADFANEVDGTKGLLDKMIARFENAMAEDGVVCIRRHV